MFQEAYQACLTLKMHYSNNVWFKNARVGETDGKYVLLLEVTNNFQKSKKQIHQSWSGFDVYLDC